LKVVGTEIWKVAKKEKMMAAKKAATMDKY
jgi:hypothetical protein